MDPLTLLQIPELFLRKIKEHPRMYELFQNTDSVTYGNMLSHMLGLIRCKIKTDDKEALERLHSGLNINNKDITSWLQIMSETMDELRVPSSDVSVVINNLRNLARDVFLNPRELNSFVTQLSKIEIGHNDTIKLLEKLFLEKETESIDELIHFFDFIINALKNINIHEISIEDKNELMDKITQVERLLNEIKFILEDDQTIETPEEIN